MFCGLTETKYSINKIEETYQGTSANYFFYALDYYGTRDIRIWMVNAFDAEFFYANVDLNKSVNIKPYDNSSKNIANSVYSNSGFYHYGQYDANNISPQDSNAWLTILQDRTLTYIIVLFFLYDFNVGNYRFFTH